jgi:hypothetical protein
VENGYLEDIHPALLAVTIVKFALKPDNKFSGNDIVVLLSVYVVIKLSGIL